jgi:hypothetical protein
VTDVRLIGFAPAAAIARRELIAIQPSKGAYRTPVPLFPDQDFRPLASRLPGRWTGGLRVPPIRLDLFTIDNGTFAVGPRRDGIVLTGDGVGVAELFEFSTPHRTDPPGLLLGDHTPIELDDVFIGFDASWSSWYHWLCFALPKAALAARLLAPSCQIVLPDYDRNPSLGLGRTAWAQSLDAFGLTERVQLLAPGLYRARRIRFFWTEPGEPTDITQLDLYHEMFDGARRGLHRRTDTPKRILIARDRSGQTRLTPAEQQTLHDAAVRFGFQPLRLEELDFRTQAETIANAEAVVGAHGAGLANILFGRRSLRIMEITMRLGGESLPRPWFYMLAHARRQRYALLDRDVTPLTPETLEAAWPLAFGGG